MDSQHKFFRLLVILLTTLGAVPLLAYPISIKFFDYDSVLLLAPYLSYSMMLIAFMCGTLWANSKSAQNLSFKSKIVFVIVSVVISLVAWFSFYMLEAITQVEVYAVLLLILLLCDFVLHRKDHLTRWYYVLRVIITIIIVLSMIYSLRFV